MQMTLPENNSYLIGFLSLIVSFLFLSPQAYSQTAKPTIRINSPFASTLWRLDVDAGENQVVSSSPYKAVTVWPLQDLTSRKILRVPIRKEQRKRAHGVAISPDGLMVATSTPPLSANNGLTISGAAKIYILKRKDGEPVTVLKNIPTRPQALRFSPDGNYLAAVLSDGCGVRIWNTKDWTVFFADDAGYDNASGIAPHCSGTGKALDVDAHPDTTGIEFSNSNKILQLVTSGDTGIRRYMLLSSGVQLTGYASPKAIGLERPGDITFSPDKTKLLIGDRRNRALDGPIRLQVAILSTSTLLPVRKPLTIGTDHLMHVAFLDRKQNKDANQTSLEQVAWLKTEDDEEFIFAGGVFWCTYARPDLLVSEPSSVADICIARFSLEEGEDEPAFIPVGTDRVMDLIALPKRGGLLYATQRRIGIIDLEGEELELPDGEFLQARSDAADFRDGNMAFKVSVDGKTVQFDDYSGRFGTPLRLKFNLAKRRLTMSDGKEKNLIAPHHDANLLEGWRNSRKPPLIYGEPLQEDNPVVDDVYRSATLNTDKKLILLGSSDFLRLVNITDDGAKLACRLRIEHEAFRINLADNGNLAIVGHSDGTLRWYRIERSKTGCAFLQLLAVHIKKDEFGNWVWAAWLPSGKFANDPRARNSIGWQVEKKPGQVGFVPYHKLLRLYDDKAVANALDVKTPAPRLKGFAPALAEAEDTQRTLFKGLRVSLPLELGRFSDPEVEYSLNIGDLGKWPRKLQIKTGSGVNMQKIYHGRTLTAEQTIELKGPGAIDFSLLLPKSARTRNRAVHVCFYIDEDSGPCQTIFWEGKLQPQPKRRLWAVIIGVSKHQFSELNLQFAQNDALDLAQLFVDDFEKRSARHQSIVAPDYTSINIDLIVSPTTLSASTQLAKLAKHPYVTTHPATRDGILKALQKIVERDRNEELSNDLMLFHFSGHGVIHPYNKDKGRSAFITVTTDPNLPKETLKDSLLTSDDLIKKLEKISAEKLVIFDACRVPPPNSDAVPFDPGLISAEFQDQVLSAHYFFSALTGQYSLDQREYAINQSRPKAERGNGLFSYTLLKALTDKSADLPGKLSGKNRIEIIEVKRYLDRQYDLGNKKSLASEFRELFNMADIQQPVYVPARRLGAKREGDESSIIRTLDP
jgi:Caspase domain/WD domain, G-beta repeat